MRLPADVPLGISLLLDEATAPIQAARAAYVDHLAQLEWSPSIIQAGLRLSPLYYPPETGLHPARNRQFDGLHGFLADSLPDGWGYVLMRRRLAKLGFRIDEFNPLERLALVGRHGRGALTYEPATTPAGEVETLDLDALAADAARILNGEEGLLADTLAKLGGGSGGARPKVHVGFDAMGAVLVSDGEAAQGHSAWIVKFPAPTDPADIGPIEAAYAAMAKEAGLAMTEHRLLEAKAGPGFFATRRFDRPHPGQRLHVVSLSGALEARSDSGAVDYDTFLRATRAITRHVEDVEAAFRRMIFNILAFNRDDHARQHSYLMDAAGAWRLAPAYDLTFSRGPGGEHYLDIAGEGRSPARANVIQLGRRHGFGEAVIKRMVDEVRAATARWPQIADEAGVSTGSRQEVGVAMTRVWNDFN